MCTVAAVVRTKWKVLLRSKSSGGGTMAAMAPWRRRWWLQFSAVVERKDRSFRGNVMQKTLILLCPRLKSPQQSWTVKNDRSKTDPRLLPSTMPLYHQTTEGSRLAW